MLIMNKECIKNQALTLLMKAAAAVNLTKIENSRALSHQIFTLCPPSSTNAPERVQSKKDYLNYLYDTPSSFG